jgi:hypothetical protein
MMNLNDLLLHNSINPEHVIVLRHRPHESKLNKVLPWLAVERPDLFNAYQQTQSKRLESAMQKLIGTGYVASFFGQEPGKAVFVGLYSITSSTPLTYEEYWQIPAHIELKKFGMKGFTEGSGRNSVLWFELVQTGFYIVWKGKLIINWPPPELSWWRRAHRNEMPVAAILEDSLLDAVMPPWYDVEFTWEELGILPKRWQSSLKEWRGIYYIFDISDRRGYVGSAYGQDNFLGRWLNYSSSGHGGNALLQKRDPRNFRFTILQRVSPDMEQKEITILESSWKQRLHTRKPYGLNEN